MSDKNVKAVLINIFGGILRCDVLAQGVIAAVTELGVPVPIVIRMEGTNVEEGKRLLRESGLNFATADSMGEAARRRRSSAARQKGTGDSEHAWPYLLDKNTRLIVQGLTGREGTFHAKAAAAYGTDGRRRRHARQGRHDPRGLARLQHRSRRGARDRRQRHRDLRAAAVCGRRDHGSRRRRHSRWWSASPRASRSSTC